MNNLEDDGSSGPDYDDTIRLLRERFEPSPETEELYERMALIDEAPRVRDDAFQGTQTTAASAREDVERSTIHVANLQRELANPRLTLEQLEALSAKLADARARLERDQKRAAAADEATMKGLAVRGDAKVVRKNVFTFARKLATANPGDGLGPLQFVPDPVASADAGLLVDIAMKPVPRTKGMLERVGLAEPAQREFADTKQVKHDCHVKLNGFRSKREGIKFEHAPVPELKAKAILKRDTLGRTSPIRVVVDKDGTVDLVFPQRPLGVTTAGGTKLGTVDAAGLVCALFPDLVEAAIDRSLDEQFGDEPGLTAAEKKAELKRIDEAILAVERIEAAAEWQRARDTGEPVRFRPDLPPKAILGLA